MSDQDTAQTQGQETTESPLLGAFSLPDGYYGETPPETPGEKPGNGESSAAEGESASADGDGDAETAGSDGSEERKSAEGERSASESEQEEDGTAEEITVSSVSELIESQEWDPDWFHGLKVPVKVDGAPAEATVKDLIDGYQMRAAAEKRLEDAKAEKKAAAEELAQKGQEVQQQLAVASELVKNAEALLDKDTASIDWKRLREDDPAEYAAKKQEIADRRQEIDKLKKAGRDAVQSWTDKQQSLTAEQRREQVKAEQAKLLEQVPEWRDSDTAEAEKQAIANDLIGRGFSREDVMGASDHRLVLLARDAWLYRKTKANGEVARKKVAKVPKVLKPGSQQQSPQKPRPKDAAEILYGNS